MAGNDSKQFLTLIRDVASEKSQGERRIINLKKRVQELQSELEIAKAENENAKREKENAEQELKGYEVELARNESAIQTLEERIVLAQDEISAYGSDIETLKNKEAEARKFQQSIASTFQNDSFSKPASKPGSAKSKAEDAEAIKSDLQDKLAKIVSHISKEKEEYQVEQNIHTQLQEELSTLERKVSLIEGITKGTMEMQELARQTSELENRCAGLGDELQRKLICPSCHRDNAEALGGILQAGDES